MSVIVEDGIPLRVAKYIVTEELLFAIIILIFLERARIFQKSLLLLKTNKKL